MNNLVTRLLEIAESMTAISRKQTVETATPVPVETTLSTPSEVDLYDHRIINVEEDAINRILKAQLRNHWLFLFCYI